MEIHLSLMIKRNFCECHNLHNAPPSESAPVHYTDKYIYVCIIFQMRVLCHRTKTGKKQITFLLQLLSFLLVGIVERYNNE